MSSVHECLKSYVFRNQLSKISLSVSAKSVGTQSKPVIVMSLNDFLYVIPLAFKFLSLFGSSHPCIF